MGVILTLDLKYATIGEERQGNCVCMRTCAIRDTKITKLIIDGLDGEKLIG